MKTLKQTHTAAQFLTDTPTAYEQKKRAKTATYKITIITMKSKMNLNLFAVLTAATAISAQSNYYENEYEKSSRLLAPRRNSTIKPMMNEEMKAVSNVLKRFDYPNGFVMALNQKNADRKAKNLGLI